MRVRRVQLRQSKTTANRKEGKVLVVTLNEGKSEKVVYQRAAEYHKPSFILPKPEESERTQNSTPILRHQQKR